jgi:hypothetical protein
MTKTGRCVRCGRKLTNPTSLTYGVGAVCAAKLQAAAAVAAGQAVEQVAGAQVLDASWGALDGAAVGR